MAEERKLISSDGSQLCNVGLVDEHGAFLYLVDAGETKHFKFTSERELVNEMRGDLDEKTAELEKLGKRFERLEHIAEAMYWELDSKHRERYAQLLKKIGVKYGNRK